MLRVCDPRAQRWWDAEEVETTSVVLLTDALDVVVGTGTLTTLDDRLGVGSTGTLTEIEGSAGTLTVTEDRVGVGSTGTLTVTEENTLEDGRESEVLVTTETVGCTLELAPVSVSVLEVDWECPPPGTNRHFCIDAGMSVR